MFDYVIVGAGSAGCVLANRLSESPDVTVLILEAGDKDRRPEIHVPAAFSKLFKTELDWNYETEPQAELNNRKLYWPRGKVLGGTSSINAMIYMRGNPRDYDAWRAQGAEGWSFDDLLPYFRKAENQQRGESPYHGSEGPLHVSDFRSPNPLSQVFIEAAMQTGLPHNRDFNGPEQDGVGMFQVTQKNGKRWSAADAYLKPAMRRKNLTVRTRAHVTRLLFTGRRVTGVEYVHGGKKEHVEVKREVALSGGTINSPQLLMLSGIGPASHLESLGIRVIADLPGVGKNLQDHLLVPVVYRCSQPITLDTAESFASLVQYLFFSKGPYTSNAAEAGAFLRVEEGTPAPDVQLVFAPVFFLNHGFTVPGGSGYSIPVTLSLPSSRGFIALRSADPIAPPLIQPNYLTSGADMKILVEGVKLARRIGQAAAFDSYREAEYWPGEDVRSEEQIRGFIAARVETSYHPVGTCQMGCGPMSVVDLSLRVRGVEGLRVVDGSVLPTILNGNINAPIMMIAERAADLIKRAP